MSKYVIAKGGAVVTTGIKTLEDAVGLAERIMPAKVYKLVADLQQTHGFVDTSNPDMSSARIPSISLHAEPPQTITRETAARVWDALQPPLGDVDKVISQVLHDYRTHEWLRGALQDAMRVEPQMAVGLAMDLLGMLRERAQAAQDRLTPAQETALEVEAKALMDRVDAIIARVRKSRGPLPPAVEP